MLQGYLQAVGKKGDQNVSLGLELNTPTISPAESSRCTIEVAPNPPKAQSNNSERKAAHIIESKSDSLKLRASAEFSPFGTVPNANRQKFALGINASAWK